MTLKEKLIVAAQKIRDEIGNDDVVIYVDSDTFSFLNFVNAVEIPNNFVDEDKMFMGLFDGKTKVYCDFNLPNLPSIEEMEQTVEIKLSYRIEKI